MSKYIIGWDIGGAHLKVNVIDSSGIVFESIQLACPLWKGVDQLDLSIKQAMSLIEQRYIDAGQALHAVTMTGELVDCFANRHEGVCAIAHKAVECLGAETLFYTVENSFIKIDQVPELTQQIASMNWHASAHWLSHQLGDALLMDIGSTTSDLIPVRQQGIAIQGQSDAARMAHNTLVYTGVVRTPLMAVTQRISFNQQQYHVAAEYFATTADIYRLLQELPLAYDLDDTADGQGKSAVESARRLARMIGHDVEDCSLNDWLKLAQNFKAKQLKQLCDAANAHTPYNCIVGAGHGRFLIKEIADKLNKNYINIEDLIKANSAQKAMDTAVAFPAYAVAMLANQYAFS